MFQPTILTIIKRYYKNTE